MWKLCVLYLLLTDKQEGLNKTHIPVVFVVRAEPQSTLIMYGSFCPGEHTGLQPPLHTLRVIHCGTNHLLDTDWLHSFLSICLTSTFPQQWGDPSGLTDRSEILLTKGCLRFYCHHTVTRKCWSICWSSRAFDIFK